MAGLVPAIHVLLSGFPKRCMPGKSRGMTTLEIEELCYVFDSAFAAAGFFAKVALRLSNSSTFTPLRRMM